MTEAATLTIDGTRYAGWLSVSVVRSMEAGAGTFEVTATDRWAEDMAARPIYPEASVTVALDGETVITGYVDDVEPNYDGKSYSVTLRGRDLAGALVDCSAIHSPGDWKNIGLLNLVKTVAAPFDIAVSADVDLGAPFKKFAVEEGESAFELISRACRNRAVLPTSDGKGSLLLTRAGKTQGGGRIERGVNVLAAAGAYSGRDQYSAYTVKGQQAGGKLFAADTAAGPKATVNDASVKRHRPLLIVAEEQVGIANCRDRAAWESRVRAGRARRATYTVAGWKHDGGSLWQPNTLARVKDDWQRIDGQVLVSSVAFSFSDEGAVTRVTVVPPDAFLRIDEPEDNDDKGFGW